MLIVNLRTFFTPQAIAQRLQALPPIKSPTMDLIYPGRSQHPLAVLGVDEISEVALTVPVVRRGSPSTPVVTDAREISYIEPLPLRPSTTLTAVDLNNFKLLDNSGRDVWVSAKMDILRRIVHRSTEALCAQSLTGTITYPVKLQGGGYDSYQVVFGTPQSYVPATAWDNAQAKITDIFKTFTEMQVLLQEAGYGGQVEIWAGKTAFYGLMALAEKVTSTARIRVEISAEGVFVGNYLVKLRAETYKNPETGLFVQIVPDDKIVMVAQDANHRLFYCAVDDLDANLVPMPFFVKPIEQKDPSGIKLVAESKPLPVPVPKAICWAQVTNVQA